MTNEFTFDSSRESGKGSGRKSCLVILLVILGVSAALGGVLVGLYFFFGRDGWSPLGEGIGVVKIEGVISESGPVVETLARFRRDKKVKAVILRVNSPGGGVAATQEIYREILRTRQEKKIIASMGSLAASGGLYVASAADKIIANPGTVTGSIGVIMQMVNIEQLLNKVGLSPVVIKSGRFKDAGSAFRTMTEEEKALLQGIVEQLHQQFIRDLAQGRGLPLEKIKALADGRIISGEEAKKLGLVDDLGNFEDALDLTQKTAGLTGRPRLIYPPRKESWWKELLSGKVTIAGWPDLGLPLTFQYLYLPGQ
ncbi:MAG: signal peptide peptidase SppA [Thermodesulfobacteriota bacterium]